MKDKSVYENSPRFRLYPTKKQAKQIENNFSCCPNQRKFDFGADFAVFNYAAFCRVGIMQNKRPYTMDKNNS